MSTALVFDIDNTLTPPRRPLEAAVARALGALNAPFALAAGSDLDIVQGQFFEPLCAFGYRGTFDAFLCNGATQYHATCEASPRIDLVREFRFREHLGAERFGALLGFLAGVLEDPAFRLPASVPIVGERIVDRISMINFAPAGRPQGADLAADARASRDAFVAFDESTGYRLKLLPYLKQNFVELAPGLDLAVSLGGQTSFDIVVKGNDKSYPVRKLLERGLGEVVYFGDALFAGGNDGAVLDMIAEWPEPACPVRAVRVDGPEDTLQKLRELGFLRS